MKTRRFATALLALFWTAAAAAEEPILIPRIAGAWTQIAGDPDLGRYATPRQQPVDFAIWQAADGTWQLWSCIRDTAWPGNTRLFHRWESRSLTAPAWTPMGIALTADTAVGEAEGGLQAPHVIRHGDEFVMFYGDWTRIAMAVSRDGKSFTRRLMPNGKSGMFYEQQLGANTRDPMALVIAGVIHLYYTAQVSLVPGDHSTVQGAVYERTSTDLLHWSDSKRVAFGGAAGTTWSSAECPFVYFERRTGYYYLFRTQAYGENAITRVYRSLDPTDFGIDDDRNLVTTLPIAAPEIVEAGGETYVAALMPNLKGVRIAKLDWVEKR